MSRKRPEYFNYLETKKFGQRKEAETWLKKKKTQYKQSGMSIKTQVSYENDQMWHAKVLPKM